MLWPKKNSYKEFEKNSCGSKIPLPPITFLMVRPLTYVTVWAKTGIAQITLIMRFVGLC